jgi:ABC-type glycerol-3-phosphate transport system substrate-binding protein
MRLIAVVLLLAVALAVVGCSGGVSGSSTKAVEPAKAPAIEEKPAEPKYSSWVVNIVDDASSSKGGMTYDIALNFNATNPTSDIAGKYTGSATAKTSTKGSAGGASVKASAIANSSQLEFTLAPVGAGSELKPLTDENGYIGKGTITMAAAGDATVGNVTRGIDNNSSQPIEVIVVGSDATLNITISGNKYTFKGKIIGKE